MTANPILRNLKSILFYLSFVVVLAVLYINLITLESKVTFTIYLVDAIVFNILIAAIGLSFWYSSVYLSIENNKIGKVILTHFGGGLLISCLLYTSDAADERSSVDLGGRRIIKKKKKHNA